MSLEQITYKLGVPEDCRSVAVELFDEAFGEKLALAIAATDERLWIGR